MSLAARRARFARKMRKIEPREGHTWLSLAATWRHCCDRKRGVVYHNGCYIHDTFIYQKAPDAGGTVANEKGTRKRRPSPLRNTTKWYKTCLGN